MKTKRAQAKLSATEKHAFEVELDYHLLEDFTSEDLIGLIYLDSDWTKKVFTKLIKKTFGLDVKITRAWGHFMKKGGSRPVHQHNSEMSFLYYLTIPEDSAMLYFPKNDDDEYGPAEFHIPQEGDLWLFPGMVKHGITEHKSDEIRWAIAGEMVVL